jgi:hypothetical protein
LDLNQAVLVPVADQKSARQPNWLKPQLNRGWNTPPRPIEKLEMVVENRPVGWFVPLLSEFLPEQPEMTGG